MGCVPDSLCGAIQLDWLSPGREHHRPRTCFFLVQGHYCLPLPIRTLLHPYPRLDCPWAGVGLVRPCLPCPRCLIPSPTQACSFPHSPPLTEGERLQDLSTMPLEGQSLLGEIPH